MFTGLSAFPLTPFKHEAIDFKAYQALIGNLTAAKVDSICTMGSTGLYPYLSCAEKQQVARTTVELAEGIPVMAGVGALRTFEVLRNVEAVQEAGVNAVLLAPVSYHRLGDEEVLRLYEQVTAQLSVPLCVYENANATNFTFSDDLLRAISALPRIGAIKIIGTPFAQPQGSNRLEQLRSLLPSTVAIGVSGDKFGAAGMAAGCDLWLSVLGGLFPKLVKGLIHLAQSNTPQAAIQSAQQLDTLWELFARNRGGVRVMASAAELLGFTDKNCLPEPLQALQGEDREILQRFLKQLALD